MLVSPPLPSFLIHIVCLYHLWDESSLVFLFFGSFVVILPSSTLRIVPNILGRYLSLWWDFCYIFWFQIVFSYSWGILFNFCFHLRFFDGVRFPIFPSICKLPFPQEFWFFFLHLVVLFRLSYAVFRFSLLSWHIFLCQIPFLYRHCISSLPVLGFPNLLHFWQTTWCRPGG